MSETERETARAAGGGDVLPEELDVTQYVGPYVFPDIARRRVAGVLYLLVAAGCVAGWAVSGNGGLLAAAIGLVMCAAYHFAAGWKLRVLDGEALMIANRAVGFPVGHASAQLAWRGLRSRPTWRLVVYSAEDPPKQRGVVELDAVDGEVLGTFAHDNPEDWSDLEG